MVFEKISDRIEFRNLMIVQQKLLKNIYESQVLQEEGKDEKKHQRYAL